MSDPYAKCRENSNKPGVPSKIARLGKSGIKGIAIEKSKKGKISYKAWFNSGGSLYLGSFSTLEEAKSAYKAKHVEKYGIDPYEA